MNKKQLLKIVKINKWFFEVEGFSQFTNSRFLDERFLSNSEKENYSSALKQNNILVNDGLFILNYQKQGFYFQDIKLFDNDYLDFERLLK